MENLTGGTPPVRPLPCVVPCKLYFTKFHRTLTTYLNTLLSNGFIINHIVEPQPPENMMDIPGMQDEMRRPMMLIVSANKKVDR